MFVSCSLVTLWQGNYESELKKIYRHWSGEITNEKETNTTG